MDDSIDIQHGHNLENALFAKILGFFGITKEEVNDSLDDVRALGLARVLASEEDDAVPLGLLDLVGGDGDNVAGVVANTVAQDFVVEYFGVGQNDLAQIVLEHGLGVGVRVGNVNFVIWQQF